MEIIVPSLFYSHRTTLPSKMSLKQNFNSKYNNGSFTSCKSTITASLIDMFACSLIFALHSGLSIGLMGPKEKF